MCFVSQVKAKFTVDDHSHYLFTPCVLTEWVLSLLRYDLTAGIVVKSSSKKYIQTLEIERSDPRLLNHHFQVQCYLQN